MKSKYPKYYILHEDVDNRPIRNVFILIDSRGDFEVSNSLLGSSQKGFMNLGGSKNINKYLRQIPECEAALLI